MSATGILPETAPSGEGFGSPSKILGRERGKFRRPTVPRKPRQPAKPTHGTCSLTLRINETFYTVVPLPGDDPDAFGTVRAFRLKKLGESPDAALAALYDVVERIDGSYGCDCADHVFAREGLDNGHCKHVAALVALGLLGKGGGRC
jgi:hypothetical protein